MRLFVAVNLPAAEQERIRDATERLRDTALPFRWVAPEALHLTLSFLGEVAEQRIDELMKALGAVAMRYDPFAIRLAGIGAFPGLRRPRVLWLGVADDGSLARLQSATAAALEPLGFPREQRAYSPHLTLARARSEARPGAFGTLAGAAEQVTHESMVQVRSIDLMRSHLSRTGARYEKIADALLGVPPHPLDGVN
jgi:2'-5' RNA ligase